jgi:hypothetical protein
MTYAGDYRILHMITGPLSCDKSVAASDIERINVLAAIELRDGPTQEELPRSRRDPT